MPHLERIVSGLAGYAPARLPVPDDPRERASVALVLAGPPADLSMCLIRRATRDDDPWSGHLALPGGRAHLDDPSARAVATRETIEEVGLHLSDAHWLGDLDELQMRPDKPSRAVLSPFAFYVGAAPPALRPEPSEVADAHWIPMSHLWDPAHLTTLPWRHRGQDLVFPGIAVAGHVLWGLTLRVLFGFGRAVGQPLPLGTDAPTVSASSTG